MSLLVLTVFPTVILTGSLWLRTLIWNPIPYKLYRYSHAKFRENFGLYCDRDSATVFPVNMAAVTSSIMLMSPNSNDRYPFLFVIICGKFHFQSLNRFESVVNLKNVLFWDFWSLTVILTVVWGQIHKLRIFSCSAGLN